MDAISIKDQMSNSKFLKGTDIGAGKETKVTISDIEQGEQDRDGKKIPQLMLHFKDKEKKLGLNVGNLETMISMYGSETDGWMGKEIILFTVPVSTPQGQPTLGIRIRGAEAPVEADF